MHKKYSCIIAFSMSMSSFTCGISTVYNMRIAATTAAREEAYAHLGTHLPSIIAGTYVSQFRKRDVDIKQTLNAGLVNYIYSFQKFYVRLDGAVGRVHEKNPTRTTTHTQMDDLLFSTGYRHTLAQKLHLAYSFLFGIPTHKDHGLEYFQLGTGHVGTGVQLDGIYTFGCLEDNSLMTAVRFIHFFNANAPINLPTRRLCLDLDLGDFVDVLLTYHKKWARHHLEVGYNPSWVYGVNSCPPLDPPLPTHGMRSTWYSSYKYIFIAHKHPMGFGFGISYGFDHVPKDIGFKSIVAIWGTYGINF